MPEHIGNISNLIVKKTKKTSAPQPKPPSRIDMVERRVDTLESTLNTIVKELAALRETVDLLKTSAPCQSTRIISLPLMTSWVSRVRRHLSASPDLPIPAEAQHEDRAYLHRVPPRRRS